MNQQQALANQITVFYSYAHEDELLRNELEKHLSLLRRQGLISEWHDRQIVPRTDWAHEIDMQLTNAAVILLLISPDFIASDYCYGIELKRALERHDANEAQVIPILLRPVADWDKAPFARLAVLPTTRKPITTWRNRDEAWADVVVGIRRAIEELPRLAVSAPRIALPPVWNIPYPRNPVFTGREELLERLAKSRRSGQAMALSQPQGISGLGGIGKTQLAVEYAYRYHSDYQAILWAGAETRQLLISDFVVIAGLLNLPEKDVQDQNKAVEAVKRWLKEHRDWLLILDNADDLEMVREFVPPTFGGHILLTTRAQAMGRLASHIEVDIMSRDIGTLFLLRRTSLIPPNAPLEQAAASDIATAGEICEELGGLPLALDQAGAYIEETQCSLSDYQHRYRMRRILLLKRRGGMVADHPEPVATTWSLSFEKVEQKSPAAADLLRCCTFLAPDAIPEELFREGASELGPILHTLSTDASLLDEAIGMLRRYSFIRRNRTEHILSIHRLVQTVLQASMNQETQQQWAERVIRTVNEVFPSVDVTTWAQCKRLLPQAEVCADLIDHYTFKFPEAANLLDRTASYLKAHARYSEAEPLFKRALAIREQVLGSTHPDTASSLNNLVLLYYKQGKYEQAEPLEKRALTIREQVLGPTHPDTAFSLNKLAMLYYKLGNYEQAELLEKRAFAIREQVLGPTHSNTASSLNNLAMLYHRQGKYEQAEPLFERALAIYEHLVGPIHPYTANTLNKLADLYQSQGKYEQAELLFKRALAIYEQVLDPTHPDTAFSLNGLATLYCSQGKYEQAEPLYQHALAVREQRLGPEHPRTIETRRSYVHFLRVCGRPEEAAALEAASTQPATTSDQELS